MINGLCYDKCNGGNAKMLIKLCAINSIYFQGLWQITFTLHRVHTLVWNTTNTDNSFQYW